jgi:hypothetical protein
MIGLLFHFMTVRNKCLLQVEVASLWVVATTELNSPFSRVMLGGYCHSSLTLRTK